MNAKFDTTTTPTNRRSHRHRRIAAAALADLAALAAFAVAMAPDGTAQPTAFRCEEASSPDLVTGPAPVTPPAGRTRSWASRARTTRIVLPIRHDSSSRPNRSSVTGCRPGSTLSPRHPLLRAHLAAARHRGFAVVVGGRDRAPARRRPRHLDRISDGDHAHRRRRDLDQRDRAGPTFLGRSSKFERGRLTCFGASFSPAVWLSELRRWSDASLRDHSETSSPNGVPVGRHSRFISSSCRPCSTTPFPPSR